MGSEELVEIIEALVTHPQIEKLAFPSMSIGRNECAALGNFLRGSTSLQELNLFQNNIEDEGVDALVAGALVNSTLHVLYLDSNPNITARGCQRLAALLEHPNSNLEHLRLNGNGVGDEGTHIFANALASNCKLKTLDLYNNGITAQGWSSFSKVLCNTSSIKNTFLSNHKLSTLSQYPADITSDVFSLLTLNGSSEDKSQVATSKILKHHRHFDMQPFFEWDLKVLPIAINWFERAMSTVSNIDEAGRIGKLQLGSIYQFIRAMPGVFEPAPAAGGESRTTI
jgi:hypothetical protein